MYCKQNEPKRGAASMRRVSAGVLAGAFCWLSLAGSAGAVGETVTARGHVYMRKGPGTNHEIAVVLKPNAELKILGTSGEWYQVQYGKKQGYVRQDVVNEAKGTNTSTAATAVSGSAAGTKVVTSGVNGAYRTLKEGMKGDDVFALQEGLIYAGYFDSMPDGKYGDITVLAVKNYQKDQKLKVDGIAGDTTQRKLLGDPGSVATPTGISVILEENAGSTGPADLITVPTVSGALKEGSKGEAVRTLQSLLQALGFLGGKVDGSFGPTTKEAVISFQKANGLKADGVAGSATMTKLESGSAKSTTATGGTNTNTTLKRDSSGEGVKQMQAALLQLGYYAGKVTGSFGTLTEDAVRSFQRAHGLSADGIAGPSTLSKLYNGSAVAKTGGTKPAASTGTTTSNGAPSAASVQNVNWFSQIRPKYKAGTTVTIYDFRTGLSWKCRFMSNGNHADSEPVTSADTETMYRAFGSKTTWNPKAVWVTMPDGKVFIASMHNTPHLSGGIKNNNFDGHLCIHFPREMKEAENTGPYAASHQLEIQKGWAETQRLAGR